MFFMGDILYQSLKNPGANLCDVYLNILKALVTGFGSDSYAYFMLKSSDSKLFSLISSVYDIQIVKEEIVFYTFLDNIINLTPDVLVLPNGNYEVLEYDVSIQLVKNHNEINSINAVAFGIKYEKTMCFSVLIDKNHHIWFSSLSNINEESIISFVLFNCFQKFIQQRNLPKSVKKIHCSVGKTCHILVSSLSAFGFLPMNDYICIRVIGKASSPSPSLPSPFCDQISMAQKDLFLLAGQSNMSGRGDVTDLHHILKSHHTSSASADRESWHSYVTTSGELPTLYRDRICFFDPLTGWSPM